VPCSPVRLLSERTTACSIYIPPPKSTGMLPASLFEYRSRLVRRPAFTSVAGMLPVRLLLFSTREYKEVLVGMTSGMVPVKLLLEKPIWDNVPGVLSRQLGRLPVRSMLLKSKYCSPFCSSEVTMSSLCTDSRAPAAVFLCSTEGMHKTKF
jgi:hypothetical protein